MDVQTSSAMALKDMLDSVALPATELARSSLRIPSGLGSYEAFLRSNSGAGAGGRHVANLKALSGVIPKMQVQPYKISVRTCFFRLKYFAGGQECCWTTGRCS